MFSVQPKKPASIEMQDLASVGEKVVKELATSNLENNSAQEYTKSLEGRVSELHGLSIKSVIVFGFIALGAFGGIPVLSLLGALTVPVAVLLVILGIFAFIGYAFLHETVTGVSFDND